MESLPKNVSGHDELKLPRCDHRFHTHCILQWLQRKKECPLCRRYPYELKVCDLVEGSRGVAVSYIHRSEGLILAIVCEKSGDVARPASPWKQADACPSFSMELEIRDEINKLCPLG